jgi:hypothetical protein
VLLRVAFLAHLMRYVLGGTTALSVQPANTNGPHPAPPSNPIL